MKIFSKELAITAKVAKKSRMPVSLNDLVDMGSGCSPRWEHTYSLNICERWAKVPTAPEILPKLIFSLLPKVFPGYGAFSSCQWAI